MTKSKNQKYQTCETYNYADPVNMETVTGESMTVQGESYTISELFARHLKGQLPTDQQRESYYQETQDFDSIDFDQLKYADPFEKQQLLEEVKLKADKALKAIEEWQSKKQTEDDETKIRRTTDKKPSQDVRRASEPDEEAKRPNPGEPGEPTKTDK